MSSISHNADTNDRVDVVVPVFNEAETVETLLDRLRALPCHTHFIFVDNGSTERTLEILRAQDDVELIEHGTNLGYGASLKHGIERAASDFVVIIDADLEFPPEEIPTVVAALQAHQVVYGSRFLGRTSRNLVMPRFRRFGNRLISVVFNILYGQQITDLYTGFKGLRRSVLDGMKLQRDGFEHVLELSARLSRKGIQIAEVPIRYQLRSTGQSKMRHLSETLKFLFLVVKYRVD